MELLERLFGLPMAAPESPAMRCLRFSFIGAAVASALGVAAVGAIAALCGRAAAGGACAFLMLVTAISGGLFFFKKSRIDERWMLDGGIEREGEGT
jgi:hypothetical protein